MLDVERLISGVHEYLRLACTPLVERIKALEVRAPEKGEKGDPGDRGEDGKSVHVSDVLQSIMVDVRASCVEVLPGLVHDAIPAPVAGPKGDPGDRGEDGKSVSLDEVLQPVMTEVRAYCDQALPEMVCAAIPEPVAGPRGDPGARGDPGPRGEDGKSVAIEDLHPIFEGWMARFALDFERRAQDVLQRAVDRLPKPRDGVDGKAGRDALTVEDFDLALSDDERTLTVGLVCGERRVEKSVRLSHPVHRGVYRPDTNYQKGDCVTFGGSTWSATRDTGAKPETDDSWRLIVKRGRDGKDGEKGEQGERGAPARNVQHIAGVR